MKFTFRSRIVIFFAATLLTFIGILIGLKLTKKPAPSAATATSTKPHEGIVGFVNSTATSCYFNTALQVFLRFDRACDIILNLGDCGNGLIKNLKHVIALVRDRRPKTYNPEETWNALNEALRPPNRFKKNEQSDANECITRIINVVDETIQDVFNMDRKFIDLFTTAYNVNLKCQDCHGNTLLADQKKIGYNFGLGPCLKEIAVDHGPIHLFKCDHCNIVGKLEASITTKSYPVYLLVEINKVIVGQGIERREITVSRRVRLESKRYNLLGVIIHIGSQNSGHYYCYIKREVHWYECNDKRICSVSDEEMKRILKKNSNIVYAFYEEQIEEVVITRN